MKHLHTIAALLIAKADMADMDLTPAEERVLVGLTPVGELTPTLEKAVQALASAQKAIAALRASPKKADKALLATLYHEAELALVELVCKP